MKLVVVQLFAFLCLIHLPIKVEAISSTPQTSPSLLGSTTKRYHTFGRLGFHFGWTTSTPTRPPLPLVDHELEEDCVEGNSNVELHHTTMDNQILHYMLDVKNDDVGAHQNDNITIAKLLVFRSVNNVTTPSNVYWDALLFETKNSSHVITTEELATVWECIGFSCNVVVIHMDVRDCCEDDLRELTHILQASQKCPSAEQTTTSLVEQQAKQLQNCFKCLIKGIERRTIVLASKKCNTSYRKPPKTRLLLNIIVSSNSDEHLESDGSSSSREMILHDLKRAFRRMTTNALKSHPEAQNYCHVKVITSNTAEGSIPDEENPPQQQIILLKWMKRNCPCHLVPMTSFVELTKKMLFSSFLSICSIEENNLILLKDQTSLFQELTRLDETRSSNTTKKKAEIDFVLEHVLSSSRNTNVDPTVCERFEKVNNELTSSNEHVITSSSWGSSSSSTSRSPVERANNTNEMGHTTILSGGASTNASNLSPNGDDENEDDDDLTLSERVGLQLDKTQDDEGRESFETKPLSTSHVNQPSMVLPNKDSLLFGDESNTYDATVPDDDHRATVLLESSSGDEDILQEKDSDDNDDETVVQSKATGTNDSVIENSDVSLSSHEDGATTTTLEPIHNNHLEETTTTTSSHTPTGPTTSSSSTNNEPIVEPSSLDLNVSMLQSELQTWSRMVRRRSFEKLKELRQKQQDAALSTDGVPILEFGRDADTILTKASNEFDVLLKKFQKNQNVIELIQKERLTVLELLAGQNDGLLDLFQVQMDALRDYYGKQYEMKLQEIAIAQGNMKESQRQKLLVEASSMATERFRTAAQHSIPRLCQAGEELCHVDGGYEYVSSLQGLIRDMMDATSLEEGMEADWISATTLEEDDDDDDELEEDDDANNDNGDGSVTTKGSKKRKQKKWYRKLVARVLPIAINYLQGHIALQAMRRAAAERDKCMPKFPLF